MLMNTQQSTNNINHLICIFQCSTNITCSPKHNLTFIVQNFNSVFVLRVLNLNRCAHLTINVYIY